MSISRKTAIAQVSQLQQQLAATGHESRKVRAMRLETMTKEIDSLTKRLDAVHAALDVANAKVKELMASAAV